MKRFLLFIGLVILAFLAFFCARGQAPGIQSDIANRTMTSLSAQGLDWANVKADGQNITLTGLAPTQSAKAMAGMIASQVNGVGQIDNQMRVADAAGSGAIAGIETQFTFENGQLTLSGAVPDAATKMDIVSQVKSMFRSVSVVDELVVSSDSMLAGWKETAMVALTQLGEFSQGTISIKGDAISMGGIVDSQASSDYVRKSLDAALNGQFTANYAINIENLPVSEPDHSHAVAVAAPVTPAAPTVVTEAVIAGCQSTFDEALIGQLIRFTTNRAEINAESHALLDSLAAAAKSCPDTHIEIEGHTDSQGSDDYNMMLSQKRAEAVLAYLIDKNVRADRLVAIGYGELQPVADNATASGRASNRRIEFTVKASE